ncbi:MAG: hypothetical protein H6978_09085 [Gammaproteobacteria bacterium]|nr:hypothetical protein [Gammaproteobacteria bacterium]
MKKLIALSMMLTAGAANAAVLNATVTGSGTYNNDASLLSDGFIPAEGTYWQDISNVHWTSGGPADFVFDYGADVLLHDIVLSVDNNDDYFVEWSTNNADWFPLFLIPSAAGNIDEQFPGGMDTFSTISGDVDYLDTLDFAPLTLRYLRLTAVNGDGAYAAGELQALSAVPLPAAVWLLGGALLPLAARVKRRQTNV